MVARQNACHPDWPGLDDDCAGFDRTGCDPDLIEPALEDIRQADCTALEDPWGRIPAYHALMVSCDDVPDTGG